VLDVVYGNKELRIKVTDDLKYEILEEKFRGEDDEEYR